MQSAGHISQILLLLLLSRGSTQTFVSLVITYHFHTMEKQVIFLFSSSHTISIFQNRFFSLNIFRSAFFRRYRHISQLMSTDFKGLNVNKKIRSLSLSQIINCTEENDSPEFSSTDVTINYVSNNQEITNER